MLKNKAKTYCLSALNLPVLVMILDQSAFTDLLLLEHQPYNQKVLESLCQQYVLIQNLLLYLQFLFQISSFLYHIFTVIYTAAFQNFIDSDFCHNYLHTIYLFEFLLLTCALFEA